MTVPFSKDLFLAKPYQNEDQFCANTNMYISQNYLYLNGFYFHIANERVLAQEAAKAKAMGVLPGVFDFEFLPLTLPHIPTALGARRPLWFLELKMPDGVLSSSQKKLLLKWGQQGILIEVAYSPEQVCNYLEYKYGKPKFEA